MNTTNQTSELLANCLTNINYYFNRKAIRDSFIHNPTSNVLRNHMTGERKQRVFSLLYELHENSRRDNELGEMYWDMRYLIEQGTYQPWGF